MMKSFTWVALGLGLLLGLALLASGITNPQGEYRLPLLMLLFMNEFGFIVTAIGAGMGFNKAIKKQANAPLMIASLGCAIMSAAFLWLGIALWPGAF
jgi:hypothetical protein